MVKVESVAFLVAANQGVFDHPIDIAINVGKVLGVNGIKGACPEVHDAAEGIGVGVCGALLHPCMCCVAVGALYFACGDGGAVSELDQAGAGGVTGDIANGGGLVGEFKAGQRHVCFDHFQHEEGCSDFEGEGGFGHGGIPNDDV